MKHKLAKLDMLRGAASSYVFLSHFIRGGLPGFLFAFGQEAVMCFFLLSGFVI
jgi:peptidoglycan/LPS O-acetylase OafA/YrhL